MWLFPSFRVRVPVLAGLLGGVGKSSSALEGRKPDPTVNQTDKSRPARAQDLAQGETAQALVP